MSALDRLPDWTLWIQALGPTAGATATSIIAMVVSFVSWQQWRIAREKVWIDLFDKRYQLMQDFLKAVYISPRKIDKPDAEYYSLLVRAHFLLGADVTEDLEKILASVGDEDYDDKLGDLGKRIGDAFELELAVPLRRKVKL